MIKKVAILANGGDVAGLNPVIRGIIKTAETKGIECYGFIDGYKGLAENHFIRLDKNPISSGLIDKGGCIIGSSTNTIVFHYKSYNQDGHPVSRDMSDECIENVRKNCIGPTIGTHVGPGTIGVVFFSK